jgi:hypothetical protein
MNYLPMQLKLCEKREEWIEMLSGNDQHSINRQLAQMAWDTAAYRVINEARRLAPPVDSCDATGSVQLNGMMHELVDRGFFVCQIAAIRRLSDSYPIGGDRGVWSLTGLLEDMLKHRHLLARRSIFEVEQIEYDRAAIERKLQEFLQKRAQTGEGSYFIPADCSFRDHDSRRRDIDSLAGVNPSSRQSDDQIRETLLQGLKEKISQPCQQVINHMNKFIAHAATPQCRAIVNTEEAGITLNHLWEAQRHMCEVAGFLSIYVLGGPQQSFLPIPQYNLFQYIERPLANSADVPALRQVWNDFSTESGQWARWKPDGFSRGRGEVTDKGQF